MAWARKFGLNVFEAKTFEITYNFFSFHFYIALKGNTRHFGALHKEKQGTRCERSSERPVRDRGVKQVRKGSWRMLLEPEGRCSALGWLPRSQHCGLLATCLPFPAVAINIHDPKALVSNCLVWRRFWMLFTGCSKADGCEICLPSFLSLRVML